MKLFSYIFLTFLLILFSPYTVADPNYNTAAPTPPPVIPKSKSTSNNYHQSPVASQQQPASMPPHMAAKGPGPAPKPKPKKKSSPGSDSDSDHPYVNTGLPHEYDAELSMLPPWKRALREKKIREELVS